MKKKEDKKDSVRLFVEGVDELNLDTIKILDQVGSYHQQVSDNIKNIANQTIKNYTEQSHGELFGDFQEGTAEQWHSLMTSLKETLQEDKVPNINLTSMGHYLDTILKKATVSLNMIDYLDFLISAFTERKEGMIACLQSTLLSALTFCLHSDSPETILSIPSYIDRFSFERSLQIVQAFHQLKDKMTYFSQLNEYNETRKALLEEFFQNLTRVN